MFTQSDKLHFGSLYRATVIILNDKDKFDIFVNYGKEKERCVGSNIDTIQVAKAIRKAYFDGYYDAGFDIVGEETINGR